VRIYLLLNQAVEMVDAPMLYTARKGKMGTGKLKTK
jgi:hypothetical protein